MRLSARRLPLVSGLAVAMLGVLLAGVVFYDIYADVVFQGESLVSTLLENALPLLFDAGIVATGYWLTRHPARVVVTQTVLWTAITVIGLLSLAFWVYGFQVVQGEVKPFIILTQLMSMGAAAGVLVGVYSGRQQQRQQQLAALFENSTDCIVEIEFDGEVPRIRDVNPAFTETFGYEASTVRGESIDDVVVDPADREQAATLSQRARAGERFEAQVARQTADGRTRIFRLQAIPIRDTGAGTGGYAVYTDITDSERYTQRVDALHRSTRDLVSATTPEEVAERGVEAASNVLGLSISTVLLASDGVLEPAAVSEDADRLGAEIAPVGAGDTPVWQVYASGEARTVSDPAQLTLGRSDETRLTAEMLVPLGDHGVFLIGTRRDAAFDDEDFTLARILGSNVATALDRVTHEQELRARERDLAQQNERLEAFASVVSHDLRNPLSVAAGYAEMAQREADDPETLDNVIEALDRMDALIDDLLAVARHGDSVEEPAAVSLESLATDAWATAKTQDATLRLTDDTQLTLDPSRCQELLENLFRNAVEHGGDEVTVTVGPLDGDGFFVEDTGPGIPEDRREDVLEQGYTTADDGTGFGLAIVAEIVDAHGGSVRVTEGNTDGARFEVRGIDMASE